MKELENIAYVEKCELNFTVKEDIKMKLRNSFIWLFLFLLVLLSACGERRIESTIPDVNANTNIVLEIVDGTLSPSGVVIKMTNHSGKNLIYGEGFTLQELIDEKWYFVPYEGADEHNIPAIGYSLDPNRNEEKKITWDYPYGTLSEGSYRLIMSFSEEGSSQEYNTAVEFSIE